MAKRRKKKSKHSFGAVLLIIVLVLAGKFFIGGNIDTFLSGQNGDANQNAVSNGVSLVHIIDVGQGLSVLIQAKDVNILIDAGEKEYGDTVVSYLKKAGVDELDYVIASHPHSDHIGGMVKVLNAFKVKNIIMPELSQNNTPTTKIYENLIDTVLEKQIKATAAKAGKVFSLGAVTLKILGPVEQSGNLNNMSVICSAKVNSTTFLFPGDAEKDELRSVYKNGVGFKCDVMIMGHHGSSSSLYKPYLASADASVAVISCGKDNSYGHPHKETIKYLNENSIKYYRTDKVGSVIFYCNSNGYNVETTV